jgi:threonine dehydrogenase-like Zn-dependent dehydrogenase
MCCRSGGTVSVIGVYSGFIDKFPMGAVMNRSLTIKTGQCHVQRYMRPLLQMIENGDIDPSFVVTHTMSLDDAPYAYDIFKKKKDNCIKVVLKPGMKGHGGERKRSGHETGSGSGLGENGMTIH